MSGRKAAGMTTLVPVPGLFLTGAPVAPIRVSDELAARLVRTGAYVEGDPGKDADGEPIVPPEWDGSGCNLDFYDPPEETPATPEEG